MLGVAKILENMEIGHNVMHGQWDWMNDPEIHSSTREWDTAQPAEQWKHSHNYVHHQFTNVLGFDKDIGYGILRMAREQRWSPFNLGQPIYNAALATLFQWGVALHDLDIEAIRKREKDPKVMKNQTGHCTSPRRRSRTSRARSGTCARCSAPPTSRVARSCTSCRATWATRSSTT
ncbi:MAG: hypothetical protein ABIW17_12375 [Marmoricola sp.]